jgi:hypothetical protein
MILIALFVGVSAHDTDVLLQADTSPIEISWQCEFNW